MIAILDVGSNSVRLLLIENGVTIEKRLVTSRLGEGIALSGSLNENAISRTVKAMKDLMEYAKERGASSVYAFATAAVRSAKNREDFLREVKRVCSLEVDVVSGEEEANLALQGTLGGGDGAVLDVGGASSELIIQKEGKISFSTSLNVGAVRLFDVCARNEEKLFSYIEEQIAPLNGVKGLNEVFGVGGTATSLACVKKELTAYSPEAVHLTKITTEEAFSLAKKLLSLSVEEIASRYPVGEKRAEILGGGALLVASILKKVGAATLIVSESDNLEGYARKLGYL